jgi:hypothetical protein
MRCERVDLGETDGDDVSVVLMEILDSKLTSFFVKNEGTVRGRRFRLGGEDAISAVPAKLDRLDCNSMVSHFFRTASLLFLDSRVNIRHYPDHLDNVRSSILFIAGSELDRLSPDADEYASGSIAR